MVSSTHDALLHQVAQWAAHLAEHGALPPSSPGLAEMAATLGLTGAPQRWWRGELVNLGAGPSTLSTLDAAAVAQRDAGIEVTDFAGMFSGEGLFLAGRFPDDLRLRPPPTVTGEMPLCVISRRLCTFDPFDEAGFARSIRELDRRVPGGYANVHVAHWEREPAAILLHFKSAHVAGWAPVRPEPHDPRSEGLGVGVADYAELEESMDAARLRVQLAGLAGTPAADSPMLVQAIKTRVPLAVQQLRANLKVGLWHSVVSDVLGVAGRGPISGAWGLDEEGVVAALAIDFGGLRLGSTDAPSAARSALQLSPRSMGARFSRVDPELPLEEAARRGGRLAGRIALAFVQGATDRLADAIAEVPGYARVTRG